VHRQYRWFVCAGGGNHADGEPPVDIPARVRGLKNIYAEAVDSAGHSTGFQPAGTYRVGGGGPPLVEGVTPTSGIGSGQAFSFRISDANGIMDVQRAQILFNQTLNPVGACLLYIQGPNAVLLLNDAGTAWTGPVPLGSSSVLQNSQCVFYPPASSASGSGNTVTLNLSLGFLPAFAGQKGIWAEAADNANQSSGYVSVGTWNVPGNNDEVAGATPLGLLPSALTQSVLEATSHPVDPLPSCVTAAPSKTVWFRYVAAFDGTLRVNTDGSSYNTVLSAYRGAATRANEVGCKNVFFSFGEDLAVSVVTGQSYLIMVGAVGASTSGYALTISAARDSLPMSVWPFVGSGTRQSFQFRYYTYLEWSNTSFGLSQADAQFSVSPSPANACKVRFDRVANNLQLRNDADTAWLGPVTIGVPGVLQNSQCMVDAANSSVAGLGHVATLTLDITFKSAFSGTKNVFARVVDNWPQPPDDLRQVGSWTVPAGANRPVWTGVIAPEDVGLSRRPQLVLPALTDRE
jgi:hypothetical protein